MRRCRDARHVAQQAHVARMVAELVGTDQRAIGLAPEHRVFLGVELLEHRGLVPHLPFEVLQLVGQLVLGDVQHADLQLGIGLGVVDQIVQPAPGALHMPHFGGVQDLVHLLGQHLVDAGDQRLDRLDRIARDRRRAGLFLGRKGQRVDQLLQLGRAVVLDAKVLFQKVREFAQIDRLSLGCAGGAGGFFGLGHYSLPP
jgi:hypothetical protein